MSDTNQPVTQQELPEALNRFALDITGVVRVEASAVKSEIAEVKAEIAAVKVEIKAAEERGQEFARGIETNLLTSFHGNAKAQTARLHTLDTVPHDYGLRLAAIEERLLNLESRRQ